MTVKIFIKRRIPEEKRSELLPLLIQLRKKATSQPGYISGETFQNYNDPESYLVIGTWQSVEKWMSWYNNQERKEIQDRIDRLLPESTQYEIFQWK